MKTLILCGIMILSLTGCATFKGEGQIKLVEDGVVFTTDKPAKMTMEKEGETYTYDSQSESLLSKIMGILTLGVLAR